MISLRQRPTSSLILIMMVLVGIAFIVVRFYYRDKNLSVDPRIAPARDLYGNYDRYARLSQLDSIFPLLDSIEASYRAIPHYRESYETGVLYVNRAAAWLTISMFRDSIPDYRHGKFYGELPADSLNQMAESALLFAISSYESWIDRFGSIAKDSIAPLIRSSFLEETGRWTDREAEKYFKNRILEIRDAQVETPRRLSVAYTNLGILCRMRGQYEDAARHYQKALELWDRNLTAENNLNRLLGRPQKKDNWLRRMFPPEKVRSTSPPYPLSQGRGGGGKYEQNQ